MPAIFFNKFRHLNIDLNAKKYSLHELERRNSLPPLLSHTWKILQPPERYSSIRVITNNKKKCKTVKDINIEASIHGHPTSI